MSLSVSSSCSWCSLCARPRMRCSPSRRFSGPLAARVPRLPGGSARARRRCALAAPAGSWAACRRVAMGRASRVETDAERLPSPAARRARQAEWAGGGQGGLVRRSGGQIRRSSLLVGRGACHRPGRTSTQGHPRSGARGARARRRSHACDLRSELPVDGLRVRVGVGTGPVVGVRRHCSGGPCACHRLHGRRLRDCAQAARFARARPDGRPAGALRPRCWRR